MAADASTERSAVDETALTEKNPSSPGDTPFTEDDRIDRLAHCTPPPSTAAAHNPASMENHLSSLGHSPTAADERADRAIWLAQRAPALSALGDIIVAMSTLATAIIIIMTYLTLPPQLQKVLERDKEMSETREKHTLEQDRDILAHAHIILEMAGAEDSRLKKQDTELTTKNVQLLQGNASLERDRRSLTANFAAAQERFKTAQTKLARAGSDIPKIEALERTKYVLVMFDEALAKVRQSDTLFVYDPGAYNTLLKTLPDKPASNVQDDDSKLISVEPRPPSFIIADSSRNPFLDPNTKARSLCDNKRQIEIAMNPAQADSIRGRECHVAFLSGTNMNAIELYIQLIALQVLTQLDYVRQFAINDTPIDASDVRTLMHELQTTASGLRWTISIRQEHASIPSIDTSKFAGASLGQDRQEEASVQQLERLGRHLILQIESKQNEGRQTNQTLGDNLAWIQMELRKTMPVTTLSLEEGVLKRPEFGPKMCTSDVWDSGKWVTSMLGPCDEQRTLTPGSSQPVELELESPSDSALIRSFLSSAVVQALVTKALIDTKFNTDKSIHDVLSAWN